MKEEVWIAARSFRAGLSIIEWIVLLEYASRVSGLFGPGLCSSPPLSEVAESVSCSKRSVSRALKTLVERGLLEDRGLDEEERTKVISLGQPIVEKALAMTSCHPPMTQSHPPHDTVSPHDTESPPKPKFRIPDRVREWMAESGLTRTGERPGVKRQVARLREELEVKTDEAVWDALCSISPGAVKDYFRSWSPEFKSRLCLELLMRKHFNALSEKKIQLCPGLGAHEGKCGDPTTGVEGQLYCQRCLDEY